MISISISNHFLMDFVIGLLFRNPKSFYGGKLCKFTKNRLTDKMFEMLLMLKVSGFRVLIVQTEVQMYFGIRIRQSVYLWRQRQEFSYNSICIDGVRLKDFEFVKSSMILFRFQIHFKAGFWASQHALNMLVKFEVCGFNRFDAISITFSSAAQPFIWFSCLSYLCNSLSAISNSWSS